MTMITQEVINNQYVIQVASEVHLHLADTICHEMENSAKARGTGIAKRSPLYLMQKMQEGKAIVAQTVSGEWVGFCYIETWEHGKFVANSGLIVHPNHRKSGVATYIKQKAFELSRLRYPDAKIIGLTTSLAVMKINSDLGYQPVTLSQLPGDEAFWKGCQTCVNYDILTRTDRKHCLCTGMLYDADEQKKEIKKAPWDVIKNSKLYERWQRLKERVLLRFQDRPRPGNDKKDRELEAA